MPSTHPHNIFYLSRMWLIVFSMFLAMLCALAPALTVPSILIVIAAIWWRSVHAYMNESYTKHCNNIFLMCASLLSLISQSAIALAIDKTTNFSFSVGLLASAILPASLCITYHISKKFSPDAPPYELKNGRVYPSTNFRKINLLWVAAGVGILSVIKPYTNDNNTLLLALALILSACTIFIIFNARESIASLNQLRLRENQLSIRYSFENLEEIREIRKKSLLAKSFKTLHASITKK